MRLFCDSTNFNGTFRFGKIKILVFFFKDLRSDTGTRQLASIKKKLKKQCSDLDATTSINGTIQSLGVFRIF